jgi:AraC family transcriptional activator of mtrCDE
MFKAGSLLRQSDLAIGQISGQVGYTSEAAFNKAFKRLMGTTPAQYRRGKTLVTSAAGPAPPLPSMP